MANREIEIAFFKEFGITLSEAEIQNRKRKLVIMDKFNEMFDCVTNGIDWDFEEGQSAVKE